MKINGQHAVYRVDNLQRPVIDLQYRCRLAFLAGQFHEHLIHGLPGLFIQRRQIQVRLSQGAQTIINAGVNVHHIAILVNQVDRRQEARALQTVAIQIVRRNIGGGDQRDATGKQRLQQRRQQHGVGDIGNKELVETQHVGLRLETISDDFQRIFLPLQFGQLFMHPQHEAVEMQP
ncbi:hypothetical protein D3C80_1055040 [compost metagenome]